MSRKLLLVLCAAVSTPALAEDPYYFHKAAVSHEAYMADVDRCASLGAGTKAPRYTAQPTNYNTPYAVESAAIASFFIGFLERREQRRLVSRIERTCMADKGYQRRAIDKPVYQEIRKLDAKDRLERLFTLVSAAQPTGKVMVE
ncbi:hypothetical protein [Novosphingobium sp. B 225]|uniref:hypothetical protein n=1 Tax=Novosphingobium sp. B 225 TaxID=1961849 RepID=UPI000B4BEC3D|nr:hypothetical protein [Novosphingobium sp. B 225]